MVSYTMSRIRGKDTSTADQRENETNEIIRYEGWLVMRFWEFELKKELEEVVEVVFKTYKNRLTDMEAKGV